MISDMLENNYNSEIFKRYSIHIIAEIFERFETENIQMKKIIDLDYFNIYQKISTSAESKKTADIILWHTIPLFQFLPSNKRARRACHPSRRASLRIRG